MKGTLVKQIESRNTVCKIYFTDDGANQWYTYTINDKLTFYNSGTYEEVLRHCRHLVAKRG